MVDDMRDFDDLEFEGLFRAFDGVTTSDALKSRTLAAIAAAVTEGRPLKYEVDRKLGY